MKHTSLKYRIVNEASTEVLSNEVCEWLKKGWDLHETVVVSGHRHLQVMTKTSKGVQEMARV